MGTPVGFQREPHQDSNWNPVGIPNEFLMGIPMCPLWGPPRGPHSNLSGGSYGGRHGVSCGDFNGAPIISRGIPDGRHNEISLRIWPG